MRTTVEMAREAGIRDCTCNGTLGCLERFAELVRADERARMAEQPAQQEPIAEQQEFSCKVCSNKPDSEGVLEHGSGCYVMQPEGGGSEFIADAIPQPAQRTWVGLTDEEILNFGPGQPDAVWSYEDQLYFARAIEAKLKEKNT